MHLIVPFATALSPVGREAWRALGSAELPHLRRLLSVLTPDPAELADEMTLTTPHERALARALGWTSEDGVFPWAAHTVGLRSWGDPSLVWARVTPVHWQLGTEQVRMAPPEALALDDDTSRALFEAVRDLFESEGFLLRYAAPTAWYVSHPSLDGFVCASLDRVVGRSVNPWMLEGARARLIRRLQNEVQMQLYGHPLNEAREAEGQMPVNSFWLSECGALPIAADAARADTRVTDVSKVEVLDALRLPALNEDWWAWTRAWAALDAGPLAEIAAMASQGQDVRLTLCGERGAQTWRLKTPTWTGRLVRWWRGGPDLRSLEIL